MTAATRQRKTRRRHDLGLASMAIDVHEHNTARAMIASGRLTPDEMLRRSLVKRELEKLVAEWIERWL